MRTLVIDTRNPKDRKKFIEFPYQIYRGNQQWTPALLRDMNLVMDRKRHPYYQHSDAQFLIAESEGSVIGRIAVLHNRNYCQFRQEMTGFFYYFDCIEDRQAASMLFDAAIQWAKARNLNRLIGPKGFLRSSGMGVLIEGFEYLPAMGIPYNYPYYADLLESYGFSKKLDHYSGYMVRKDNVDERVHKAAELIRKRGNFQVRAFRDKKEIRQFLPQVKVIQEEAFVDNPNFYPSTEAEIALIGNTMIQAARPQMIKLIFKGDELAGFIISYPNINQAIQKTGGRIYPFGWIRLLRAQATTTIADVNGVGLLPKYQGMGANALLYAELEKTLRQYRQFEKAEFVQVNEDNFRSRSDMEKAGVHFYKTHRTYQINF
mgnify:CR=1 FL=1